MPRKPRIESSDGFYHVINRGNYQSSVFETEGARLAFEKTLFEACGRFGWRLEALCMMSNLETCQRALGMLGVDPTSTIKSAPWKLAIASKFKREGSVTNAWLARSLAMGVPKAVSAQVGRYRKEGGASCKFAARLRKLNIEQ